MTEYMDEVAAKARRIRNDSRSVEVKSSGVRKRIFTQGVNPLSRPRPNVPMLRPLSARFR